MAGARLIQKPNGFLARADMAGKSLCENPLKSGALESLRIALPGVVGFHEIID
jgi:hypothetical protein